MATFGERLRLLREEKGLSQALLAEEIGVASNTVSIWERGVREPLSNELVNALAAYFDVPITYLAGISDSRTWPIMSDEDAAETAEAEEKELEESMLKLYRDLCPEMQGVVRKMVTSLWKAEKNRGLLMSQNQQEESESIEITDLKSLGIQHTEDR